MGIDSTVAQSGAGPQFLAIGSIVVDDLILPDGQTRMGMLGGGVLHAAMGMRAWSERVGVLAAIGEALPEAAYVEMARAFDLRGLVRRDGPTPRAWQVCEADGRRTDVFRTDAGQYEAGAVRPGEFPAEYAGAAGVYLACKAPDPFRDWVARLRAEGCACILWEPWSTFCRPKNRHLFRELAPLVDVVSPNLLEARQLTGLEDARHILSSLLDDGARAVAVRMGEAGSLVAAPGRAAAAVPAVPVERIVDVTGAGNAYCGGLVVGLAETGDLGQAALYGAASASLALEQFGAMYPLDGLKARAAERLCCLKMP